MIVTAMTSARLDAATAMTEARKTLKGSYSLICLSEEDRVALMYVDQILCEQINKAMRADAPLF